MIISDIHAETGAAKGRWLSGSELSLASMPSAKNIKVTALVGGEA